MPPATVDFNVQRAPGAERVVYVPSRVLKSSALAVALLALSAGGGPVTIAPVPEPLEPVTDEDCARLARAEAKRARKAAARKAGA